MIKLKDVLKQYEIGDIKSISEPVSGSNDSWIIHSSKKNYVLKRNQRQDYIDALKLANSVLDSTLQMNAVVASVDNMTIVNDSYALYEYIEGNTICGFSEISLCNILEEIARLNVELRRVDIEELEIKRQNYWDDAINISYISSKYIHELSTIGLESNTLTRMANCIDFILLKLETISHREKQLIHSDLGIDNMILTKNNNIRFIDFSPLIDSHYMSIASFVYWEFIYNVDEIMLSDILECYSKYESNLPNNMVLDEEDKYIYLLKYSMYKLVGATLMVINSQFNGLRQIKYRLLLLEELISLLVKNQLVTDDA